MKTINGQLFKEMMISGANNLYNHYPEIDALNVFPVPDGDTGMNMNLTLSSGAKEIQNRNDDNVYDISKAFSRGLLMGARGNSGVITSQIFRGFTQGIEGKAELTAMDFAEGLVHGKDVAYKAVMRPVEGTILTVIREASEALMKKVSKDMPIEKAIKYLIQEAKVSLDHTPELLPVLKEVGVVDSGGAGLVTIFEGMQSAICGHFIEKSQATATENKGAPLGGLDDDGENKYCVEFIMTLGPIESKKQFIEKRFTNVLSSHGAVLNVITGEETVKVHIHTGMPGTILNYAQNFGEFTKVKVEALSENHTSIFDEEKEEQQNLPLKDYAIIAVSAGAGLDTLFKEIGVDQIVSGGQTMNPSTEDFIDAINKAHAKHVFLLPNNSNIVMAATQAAEVFEGETIAHVIPSKTIPQGLVSAMTFNSEVDAEENEKEMKSALSTVKSGSITYAIKDTDIEGVHVTKDYFMGIVDKQIAVCEKDKFKTLFKLLETMIDEDSAIVTLIVGEDVKDEEMDFVQAKLAKKYIDIDVDIKRGDQPVYSFLVGVE